MKNVQKCYRKTPLMGWASWNCFFTDINEEKIKAQADALIRNGAVFVDARTRKEYADKHLPGAVNMPYTEAHWCASRCVPDKTTPLIVYCAAGKRSSQVRTTLNFLGYKEVYYLGGVDLS